MGLLSTYELKSLSSAVAPVGMMRLRAVRFDPSAARMWVKRVKSSGHTWRAVQDIGISCLLHVWTVLSSGSSPTWYPAVPALSTSMSDNPLSFATCRITASPNGDLQMLPRHTMSTEGITVTVLDMI